MFAELVLAVAIGSLAYAFYKWATINNDYFKRRGIKSMNPTFLIGNMSTQFLKRITAVEFAQQIYNRFPEET